MLPGVQTPGKGILEPLHPGNKVRFGSAEDSMVVVIHEDPTEDLPTGPAAGFGKRVVKQFPVPVIVNNGFAAITSGHHMINGVLVFDARSAGHDRNSERLGVLSRNVA